MYMKELNELERKKKKKFKGFYYLFVKPKYWFLEPQDL